MLEHHKHPFPIQVYGTRLVAGDKIREGDVFASTTGKWERALPHQIGLILREGTYTYWVRPDYSKH
jgi:hypothetical protein